MSGMNGASAGFFFLGGGGDLGRRAIYFQSFGEKGHLFSSWIRSRGQANVLDVLRNREQRFEEMKIKTEIL